MEAPVPLENLPDCELRYLPGFLPPGRAEALFRKLLAEVPWREDTITLFGKTYPQPRLTALYGEGGKTYAYSGITLHPLPFTPLLQQLREAVERESGHDFSTVLINLYRDGRDSNGWHADNERELGPAPVIASLSLGAPRAFHLKHRHRKEQRCKLVLEPGSLLLMAGDTQRYWLHQVPKTRRAVGPRINLTFRKIFETGA
jgi:alkylated DNA repair dioxygenase AlkB